MIKKIIEDQQAGNQCQSHEWSDPDLAQVLSALNRLDGKAFSSTMFFVNDDTLMSVGGGAAGLYVVFVAIDVDRSLLTLVTGHRSDESVVELVAGGQAGSYPRHQCVDKEMARQALVHFFTYGTVAPDLVWELENQC